ncbi:hypothetical protein [Cohnella sp. JJ-181]|uniref:hypothetical protein n=1 Tax=Cohnella rhizoplanae TaxID=2974897 RepID=UPI0022FF8923|nr:hypothetical protein [Cohnella sp. JJ-181]CAI6063894.1 hypothetical protein COHCIP112018_01996 [Cohnella sp. JJ-181]
MWKWIGWAAQLVAMALLVSFLSIWTTGYIVTSYVQTALKGYGITLDEQPFAMSGVWGKMWGADGANTAADKESESAADEEDADAADQPAASPEPTATPDTATGAGGEAPSPPSGGDAESAPSPEPAPAPTGSETEGQAAVSPDDTSGGIPSDDGSAPVWNGEEGAPGASGLTDEEKQQIYSVVVSKLSSEQLSQLTDLIRNGLTDVKVPQMESLLRPVLSDEEYATMMEALGVPSPQ